MNAFGKKGMDIRSFIQVYLDLPFGISDQQIMVPVIIPVNDRGVGADSAKSRSVQR